MTKLCGKPDQENQSLTVSENVYNKELECWEHSDKFIPDLVAMISANCCRIDTKIEVVLYTTSWPLTTKELLWRRIKQTLPHKWDH